ncbi:hypothetical protein CN416_04275 [Bacillus thuringiensis]|nr:hypothetical protein CN416_04275 [Bacillus thuringiensis]
MLNVLIILAIIFLVVVLSPILIPLGMIIFTLVAIVFAFIVDLITYPFRVAYKLIKEAKRNR